MTTRLDGVRELQANFRRLERMDRTELQAIGEAGAAPILEDARRRAPFGSIAEDLRQSVLPTGEVVVHNTPRVYWGRFWEFGTRYIRPRPFFRPAWEGRKLEALRLMGDRAWAVIRRKIR
jgi:HK97 gp10 family phage protein